VKREILFETASRYFLGVFGGCAGGGGGGGRDGFCCVGTNRCFGVGSVPLTMLGLWGEVGFGVSGVFI
jgi:hypothetical protein